MFKILLGMLIIISSVVYTGDLAELKNINSLFVDETKNIVKKCVLATDNYQPYFNVNLLSKNVDKYIEDNYSKFKKLDDLKILEIVPKIVRVIPYNTVILNNKEYNSRYSSNINMNAIKAIMHNKVLSNISKEHNDFEYAVVDQFTYPNAYFSYLKNCSNIFRNITFLTKAEDQVLSVACASIISRYVFIKEMAKISKELGILIPKGASTAVDEVALKIASEKGFDVLTNYVKLNFKNTEKVKELLKNA